MRQLCRQFFRFSTTQQTITKPQSSSITTAEQKFTQTPIHLRPYDKLKYQVLPQKIKKNSGTDQILQIIGYALLQIEPFPRARIMKICYNILQQVKIGIPETFPDRIYIEQQTKYVMEMTDKIQDIQQLQDFFGTDSIELMIHGLTRHLEFIEIMRKHKFWEMKPDGKFDVINETVRKHSVKFPIYKKGERPVSKLIE